MNRRSQEHQDLLERSTKKTKVTADGMVIKTVEVIMETLPMSGEADIQGTQVAGTSIPKMSFKDSLLSTQGTTANGYYHDDEFLSNNEEINKVGEEEDCPMIPLTKAEKARLRRPWHQTFIIKVMGRTVGYNYLLKRLKVPWHTNSHMEMVAIDNGYFLVKFSSLDDYNFAKYEGPWMVLDHYRIVKEWYPNFNLINDTTKKMLVWVRFSCLPIEYYGKDFLIKVGEKFGKLIRVD
ncbi:hypothetical protein DITRI_Ditri15bG0063100 [Diplodiscus trichospermus]